MDLTPRLQAIGNSIDKCDTVADIGSDHAYLPIYLINNGKAKKVIASDINKGPASISMRRIKEHGLEQYIEVRIGDGLKVLNENEVDIIVIAGMGGLLIQNMLNESRKVAMSAREIILQPMRDSRYLINWLLNNCFQILNGEVLKEKNKFYQIIWTRFNEGLCDDKVTPSANEIYYYKNTPVLHEYIENKIEEYLKIIKHLEAFDNPNNEKRIYECRKELEGYKEAKAWLSLNAVL